MAGDQEPEMPLVDVLGKEKLPPAQIAGTCVNVGVMLELIAIVMVVEEAH